MRRVLAEIDRKTTAYARSPFFSFLRDPTIDVGQKLSFAPHVAHFALTFGDLCTLVLRDEPASDEYQELVNTHTYEDEGHWRWYLADLDLLGENRELHYCDAIKRIWSDATVRMRRLSYQLCSLALGGDSLQRLMLVHCIEGAFHVTLAGLMPVANELKSRTGKVLTYMGPGHSDVETSHVMEEPAVRKKLAALELDPRRAEQLCHIVGFCFRHFTAFSDELLELSKAGHG
jgi:hypothetical protein